MSEVDSAEQATDIAVSFLKKEGWVFPRAVGAHREDDVWLVEVDVGSLLYRVATVKINARTSGIIEYRVPPAAP